MPQAENSTKPAWLRINIKSVIRYIMADLPYLPELFILIILLCFLLAKIELMKNAATDTFAIAVAQHDSIIISFIMCLYALNLYLLQFIKVKAIRIAIRTLCLLVVLVYICDIFVYFFFSTRLYISDAITFSSEMNSFGTLLRTGLTTMVERRGWFVAAAALAIGATFYFCFAFLVREPTGRSRVLPITAIGILLSVFYIVPLPAYVYAFGDKPLFENFVERNVSFFNQAAYSDAFRKDLDATPVKRICHAGSGRKLNVIVVIVESLSAYQSKYFSGIEDWTPRLDRLARTETALTNFHANGWTTIGGLISTLTGTFPFVPEQAKFNAWGSPRLDDFAQIPETLPRTLASDGYQTTFVSAGDLAFLGQGDWLRAIGYERIVGNKDPRFAKQKVRGPFDSVPDRLLYEVMLDEMDRMKSGEPYFITAQTFWSHRPFMAPDGSALHSEEHVMRITDQMLGELYDKLLAKGFFENGILFVTGDHRAMEPYRKAEFDRFGATAVTRIPGIIVTHAVKLPSEITGDYQQRDLAASIRALVQDEYCVDQFEGTILGPNPTPPACIMHARGDDRDLILVKCGDREGVVRVAGDATAVASGAVPDDVSVIQTINKNRIRIGAHIPAVQSAEAH